MINIFVITLSHAKERQEYISSVLKNANINFEFIFGANGADFTEEDLKNIYDPVKAKKFGNDLTNGQIGCSLSHKMVYQHIIEKNIERAIVIEDDARISPEFFTLIPVLENFPIKGYMIKFDKVVSVQKNDDNKKTGRFTPWHRKKLTDKYFIGQPLVDPKLTWCYYIDNKAAVNLLKIMPKIFHIPDQWDYFRYFTKLRIINKTLVFDNDDKFISMIGPTDRNKVFKLSDLFILKLIKKAFLLIRLLFH
jgi:glycosyl transferase family 25